MFNFFKKAKKEPENLKEIQEYLQKLEGNIGELTQNLEDFKVKSQKSFQKIGIVRFNPFKEIGGDQSFSVALLDAQNSGFVISSLYGKEGSRVFAKPIENGQSKYLLSEEEKEAINKATKIQ